MEEMGGRAVIINLSPTTRQVRHNSPRQRFRLQTKRQRHRRFSRTHPQLDRRQLEMFNIKHHQRHLGNIPTKFQPDPPTRTASSTRQCLPTARQHHRIHRRFIQTSRIDASQHQQLDETLQLTTSLTSSHPSVTLASTGSRSPHNSRLIPSIDG